MVARRLVAQAYLTEVEVVAVGELAKCEAVAKKRKRIAIDPDVKDWFLHYHECMKVKNKWNMKQSWRRAQEMLPSLLKDVHETTFYSWTHSDHGKKTKASRKRKLNIENNLASQVA